MESCCVGRADICAGERNAEGRRIHFQCDSAIVFDGEVDVTARRGAHREAAVILFEKALRGFAERLDHQASILVEHTVRAAILREGVMEIGRETVKFQNECAFELRALGGRNRIVGKNSFRGRARTGQRRETENGPGERTHDRISILAFRVGEHCNGKSVGGEIVKAAAVAEQRAVLADPAMIVFMIDADGEAVLVEWIIRIFLSGCAFGSAHLLVSLGLKKIFFLNGAPEPDDVTDRAANAKVIVIRHIVFIGGDEACAKSAVGMREAGNEGEIVTEGSGFYSGGGKDILLDVIGEGLVRNAFDNRNQKLEAGDGPIPFRARLVNPFFICIEGHHFVKGFGKAAGGFDGIAEVVVINDAGGVIEQIANRDVASLCGKFGDVSGNVIVKRELAAIGELQDGDSGEWQHGADNVIDGFVLRRRFETEVGKAVAFVEQDGVAAHHEDGGADDVLVGDDLPRDCIQIGRC